ncbi:unnamed protein product [Microthlaspi erraticum]|uniref:Uncharacterized protein n=1 Tax=Microthlaspi erraticum TaxID=1685480 RepID=A0A6D2ILH0_9BRAS|nr:unnamed protein product [Microthlaspi erraticum]
MGPSSSSYTLQVSFHNVESQRYISDSLPLPVPKLVKQPDPDFAPVVHELESQFAESCEMVSTSYGVFKSRAAEQGCRMSESLLNPGRARLCNAHEEVE